MMGRALHKPDPPEDRLASIARSEDLADWTFVNRTTFCVEVDGTVGAVKTLRSTGIPRIDAVVRETVAEWRFSPFEVGGKPTRICSEARFNLRFPG
ncbi:energy transducer TonB [Nannocystis pusilla]|uniref:energy transducer TonB n=1 Tax=Nannocystis pusilla TaxID=889268 RepID=UPI003B7F7AEF